MAAKPIAIIYFPQNFGDAAGRHMWIYDYMRYLNGEQTDGSQNWDESKRDYWKDYYWFCFYDPDIKTPESEIKNKSKLYGKERC